MKLYATVESERAKKGQGGQYLDIGIQNEYKEVVATINIRAIDGAKGYETRRTIKIWYNGLTEVHAYKNSGDTNETKGEKQKPKGCVCGMPKSGATGAEPQHWPPCPYYKKGEKQKGECGCAGSRHESHCILG